jgi:hypothetical protein
MSPKSAAGAATLFAGRNRRLYASIRHVCTRANTWFTTRCVLAALALITFARLTGLALVGPAIAPPSSASATYHQVVVITDNPFLISNLPERRKEELSRAVRMNLDSPYVASLHLLNQAPNQTFYPGGKLHVYNLGWRSTFLDAIRYANAALPKGTTFVVSNADIVFAHESVSLVPRIKSTDVVVALSRHEVQAEKHHHHQQQQQQLLGGGSSSRSSSSSSRNKLGATLHPDPALSQDAWFMRTPFPEDPGFDFPMGTLGSDNKLAYLYHTLNKTVVNWCADVVIWHFHASQHRSVKARIPQPYSKVPQTRVNVSMLDAEWRAYYFGDEAVGLLGSGPRRRPRVSSSSPMLHTVALDLPRISGPPLLVSNVNAPKNRPEWTPSAVKRMFNVVKRRAAARNISPPRLGGAAYNNVMVSDDEHAREVAATLEGHFYFLDAPWQVLVQDLDFMRMRGPLAWFGQTRVPASSMDRTFALIPEEVVPAFCRSAARAHVAWRQINLGVIDGRGDFTAVLACPPMSGGYGRTGL